MRPNKLGTASKVPRLRGPNVLLDRKRNLGWVAVGSSGRWVRVCVGKGGGVGGLGGQRPCGFVVNRPDAAPIGQTQHTAHGDIVGQRRTNPRGYTASEQHPTPGTAVVWACGHVVMVLGAQG